MEIASSRSFIGVGCIVAKSDGLPAERPPRVAIGSLGTIGRAVAKCLLESGSGFELKAVGANNTEQARQWLQSAGSKAEVVALKDLGRSADIVVECAPPALFPDIARPAIEAGLIFIPASVGGLLANPYLIDLAAQTGARIVVPTGAIAGLDAVRAAAKGQIDSVTLVSRKAPHGLAGAPHLADKDFQPDQIKEPMMVFSGNTYDAAKAFPANVNVAAALAFAGIGPNRTMVEVWAIPGAKRTSHTIKLQSDSVNLNIALEVVPSPDNPKSSTLAPLSIVAALESLIAPVRIGS